MSQNLNEYGNQFGYPVLLLVPSYNAFGCYFIRSFLVTYKFPPLSEGSPYLPWFLKAFDGI